MCPSFALPDEDPDRLAELGRIAGPLVHELKNPLGVITMNAELLRDGNPFREETAERAQRRVERILDAARSLQDIVQSFLAFARPSRIDAEAVDINALLEELIAEQQPQFDQAGVTVHTRLDEDLSLLAADRQHLRSIFRNVLTNAREALVHRTQGRRLLVVTRHAPGEVRVMIANNGPPLDAEVAAHLFEPFRSTKETGTGLGLAIVRRLVELHRGTIQVSSDKDQGVSFTFEFPTSLGPAKTRTALPIPLAEAVIRDEPQRPTTRRRKRKT